MKKKNTLFKEWNDGVMLGVLHIDWPEYLALAQAKHIYEWLHEDCKEHIRTTKYLGIRMEGDFLERRYCPECMEEFKKEINK